MPTFSLQTSTRRSRSPLPIVFGLLAMGLPGLLWIYGWRSLVLLPLLACGFLVVHALRALFHEAHEKANQLPESGELPYGFAGHVLRVFSDEDGGIWIRAGDLRHLLGLERSDSWMAQAYPEGYRRAHAGVPAWFIRPETVRQHWGKSTRIDVNRFLAWMDRELIPLQRSRSVNASPAAGLPPVAARIGTDAVQPHRRLLGYFVRHWRGEHHLLQVVGSGCLLALLTSYVLGDRPAPADFVEHYRRHAFFLLLAFVSGTILSAWWGVGAWRAAQRSLNAGRSLLIGLLFAMGGMTTLLYAFHQLAEFDRQMTVFSLALIAADLTPKPTLQVSPDGSRLVVSGELGLGSTLLVRSRLEREPGVTGVELDSPGGSAAEGFALAAMVRDRGLATYVRADCASACVLVFAGGHERRVAPSARFGLHRAGVSWRADNGQVSYIDRKMGGFLAERGVSAGFIEQALATPHFDLWLPSLAEVMQSGLANASWLPDSG